MSIIILNYIIGSIPFGFLLVKYFQNTDIRMIGSHNIGATNVLRTGSKKLAFTTHTPVPSGNEVHSLKLLKYMGAFNGLTKEQVKFIGGDPFSMTAAGLRLSYISNGVAELHAKTAQKMWEDVEDAAPIIAVTNGVHNGTWQDSEVYAAYGDGSDILEPHSKAKATLFKEIKKRNKVSFDPNVLTIGFARRAAPYKRGTLIFSNMEKLQPLLDSGKIQIIFSGKAHPNDLQGKKIVAKMFELAEKYPQNVVFLQNYDMTIGRLLTRGCDIWLNNPRRPMESAAAKNATLAEICAMPFFGFSIKYFKMP